MRILVTGSAGFIGFHVAKALLERGDEVVGIDNFNDYYDPALKEARTDQIKNNKNYTLHRADITSYDDVLRIMQETRPDAVCHLAAQAGVRYSLENPHAYVQSNLVGFLNVLEAMRHAGVTRLTYASSSSVYGNNTKMPYAVEDRVDHPLSLYAATKKSNELMAHTYHHLFGLQCTGLRFFTVYGPWGRPDMALFLFTKAMTEGRTIKVFNYGNMQRDFTYVDDVVQGVMASLDTPFGYCVLNIGQGKPQPLMRFIEVIERELCVEAHKELLPFQPGDVAHTCADTSAIEACLGYTPSTSIEEWYSAIYSMVSTVLPCYTKHFKRNRCCMNAVIEKEPLVASAWNVRTFTPRIALVGLGYVGLPLLAEFGRLGKGTVTGFDVSAKRVEALKRGEDGNNDLEAGALNDVDATYVTDPSVLRDANFIIVAVPTPIGAAHQPDLSLMEAASRTVGENLSVGSIVVFESTVYPGVTEEVCVPILEQASGLKCGEDFKVGYSPERVNPGDRKQTIDKVVKIVSGMDDVSLEIVATVYGSVCRAGVHKAPNIKTAEAAKVIENVQRDLNIALMNELSIIFHRIGINTHDVLEAAGTKWNFHRYTPGLVGGHCIGVDPYYLTYKAEALGYHPEIILAGRRVNDSMGAYVGQLVIRGLVEAGKVVQGSRVLVIGLTFKPNVRDIRNSKVLDTIKTLNTFSIQVFGHDPLLSVEEIESFGVTAQTDVSHSAFDAVVLAAPHDSLRALSLDALCGLSGCQAERKGVLIDVFGTYHHEVHRQPNLIYACL